jgi:hypothetical protein
MCNTRTTFQSQEKSQCWFWPEVVGLKPAGLRMARALLARPVFLSEPE